MSHKHQSSVLRLGQRGTLVIPAALRREMGLKDGDAVLATLDDEGRLLLRQVPDDPLERMRRAFAGDFDGIDAVEYQRSLRDEDEE